MKIFAIGWNYPAHNKELNNPLRPKEPVIFLKPESALLKSGKPFFIPDFSDRVEYETELVIRVCKLGKNIAAKFAHRYYDAVTVGIDFTARDLQQRLRAEGAPWEISKGFDSSAAIGEFIDIDNDSSLGETEFHLEINGVTVQEGNSQDMLFNIDEIIAHISKFYTLKIGDLIYTGTPVGVGGIKIDDHLEGYIGDKKLLDFYIR